MKWEKVKLGNYVKILSGYPFESNQFSDKEGKPLIRIRDIKRGFTETFYTGKYEEAYLIKQGDLLIGMDGEFNIASWEGEESLLNQRVCKIETEDFTILDNNYLKHFLPQELKKIENRTAFVTVKHLSVKSIENIQIPLPPLSEQKRIAAILDKADVLRRKDEELLKKYDELAQSIFIDMFGDPVKNEKGWEVKRFGDIIDSFKYGTNEKSGSYSDNSIPVLRIPNIIGDDISLNDLKYSKLSNKEIESTLLRNGDLLFVRTNGNPNYIGRSAVFNLNEKFSYASYLIRARMNTVNVPLSKYIQFAMSYKSYRPIILKKTTTTAGNYNINTVALKNLEICIPSMSLLKVFSDIIENIKSQKNKKNCSESLFRSLLYQAFKGEL